MFTVPFAVRLRMARDPQALSAAPCENKTYEAPQSRAPFRKINPRIKCRDRLLR